jgi:hypothetical protein
MNMFCRIGRSFIERYLHIYAIFRPFQKEYEIMNLKKNRSNLASLFVCLLVITLILTAGCQESDNGDSKDEPFTANEKLDSANERASEWKSDPVLVGILGLEYEMETSAEGISVPEDPDRGDGKCMVWIYSYFSANASVKLTVTILANGDITENEEGGSSDPAIDNWSTDSDSAANVAKENGGSGFLDNYPETTITYSLGVTEGKHIWTITFRDDLTDTKEMLTVTVNAETGTLIDAVHQSF